MVGDIDVTPINLFGGIPDEDLDGKTTESTWLPPKTPQAMSTPITEGPGSALPIPMTQDSVSLPTPRLSITHQEERGTSTSYSTLSNPPTMVQRTNYPKGLFFLCILPFLLFNLYKMLFALFAGSLVRVGNLCLFWGMVVRGCARRDLCKEPIMQRAFSFFVYCLFCFLTYTRCCLPCSLVLLFVSETCACFGEWL